MMRYTPDKIFDLESNEIFVFGSNESGIHGAGAAKLAFDKFGAVWGVGYGHEGKSFAIPTKDFEIQTLSIDKIKKYVDDFIKYAEENEEFNFLVTEIGCGLAGWNPKDIAPLFKNYPLNVILPKRFVDILRATD